MASTTKANIHRYFIALYPRRPFRCHKTQSSRHNLRVRESRAPAKPISRDISLSGNLSNGSTFLQRKLSPIRRLSELNLHCRFSGEQERPGRHQVCPD
jgi:hypothetical protein